MSPSYPSFPGNFSGSYESQLSQLSREFLGSYESQLSQLSREFPGCYESQVSRLSRDFPGISTHIFNANESQLSREFYSFPRLLNFPGNPGFNPRKIPGISRECPSFFRTGSAKIFANNLLEGLQPARNKLSSKFSPTKLRVTERKGSRITATNGRYVITRNISHFKKVAEVEEESEEEVESSDEEEEVREEDAREEVHGEQGPRRSGRTRKQVDRYGDLFPTEFV